MDAADFTRQKAAGKTVDPGVAQGLIMDKKELLEIANTKLLKVTNRPEIVMCKGQGMYLADIDDNEYLDFIGGWAVNCLGHSPKVISNILIKQSRTLVNASPSFYNFVSFQSNMKLKLSEAKAY